MRALTGETMGSNWLVQIAEPCDDEALKQLEAHILEALEAVNASMSVFRDDSELSRINAANTVGPHPLSAPLRFVLENALKVCVLTEGRYDITVGPLVDLWGFGPKKTEQAPRDEEVKEALKHVGYQHLRLSPEGLYKDDPAVHINLSSIAKGYGVDCVAECIEAAGFTHYAVEIGGELRISGTQEGKPWRVALETPVWNGGSSHYQLGFENRRLGIASSANYRNYRDYEGIKATHVIDPRTGYPQVCDMLMSTVIADSCMLADVYASAIFVMGKEAEHFFAEYGIPALMMWPQSIESTDGSPAQILITPSPIMSQILGNPAPDAP